MAVHRRTIRLFVSSTFSDMKAERDLLQRDVFPRLQNHALSQGLRFQAIDLRWGVSEEAGKDNRTLRICLRELQRCQAGPIKPNFLVLLGDRYGWRPLPETLPARLFERLCAALPAGWRNLLEWRDEQPDGAKGWYRLDDNAVPPVYELQPRYGRFETLATWEEEVERPLLAALEAAAETLRADPMLPEDICAALTAAAIGRSATHQEIQHGALALEADEARKHVHAFARKLQGSPDPPHRNFIDLFPDGKPDSDARERQEALRDELKHHLGRENNYHEYPVVWRHDGKFSDADLGRFAEDVFTALKRVIDLQAADLTSQPPLELEEIAHLEFGADRRQGFRGRKAPLTRIADSLNADAGRMLAVLGPAGWGKSALMAEAVREARDQCPQACVIERYLGTTPSSSDLIALLRNLVAILRIEYPPSHPAPDESRGEGAPPSKAGSSEIPFELQPLIAAFRDGLKRVTAEKPLVLFLDALDQITCGGHPAELHWLSAQLPPHVRLVVSTALPVESTVDSFPASAETDVRTRLLRGLEILLPADRLLHLSPLAATDGAALLDRWLAANRRTLTSAQRALVLETFATEGNPLWLRIAAEEACRWHSWQAPPALPSTLPALLTQVLDRLAGEEEHGEVLVQRALGYLACARYGLAEDEMIAVLGADRKVICAIIAHSPTERAKPEAEQIRALPLAVWVRLYGDITDYLGELELHGVTLMRFYHHSFLEAVRRKFLTGVETERDLHRQLSLYFKHALPSSSRSLVELPFQLARCGQIQELEALLSDVRHLHERCELCDVYELISDYDLLGAVKSGSSQELRQFLKKHAQRLARYRNLFIGLTYWEGPPGARNSARQLVRTCQWNRPCLCTEEMWFPPMQDPAQDRESVEVLTFSAFDQYSCAVALAPDAGSALFYRRDGRIGLVDILRGKVLEGDLQVGGVPLRIVVDASARDLALLDMSGEGRRLKLLVDSSGHPMGFEEVGRFEYRIPKCEAPVAQFVGKGLWFQQPNGDLAVMNDHGVIESSPFSLSHWELSGELSALVPVDGRLLLAQRYQHGTRVWLATNDEPMASVWLEGADLVGVTAEGPLVALALTSFSILVYEVTSEFAQIWSTRVSELPCAMSFRSRDLWYVSEMGTLHVLSADDPHIVRAVGMGDLRLAQVQQLLPRGDDEWFVLTLASVLHLRVRQKGGEAKSPLLCVYDAADGEHGYYALCERDDGVHLIDGVSRSVTNLIQGDRSSYVTAIDGDYHLLGARLHGQAFLIDLDCRGVRSVSNVPEVVISVVGSKEGGFWLADTLGRIYSVNRGDYRCELAARLNFISVSNVALCCCDDKVVATGVCVGTTVSGSDMLYFVVPLSQAANSPARLMPLGTRLFPPENGKLLASAYDVVGRRFAMFWGRGVRYELSLRVGTLEDFVAHNEKEIEILGVDPSPTQARFSPDGKWLYVLSTRGNLFALDGTDYRVQAVLSGSAIITSLADSPLSDQGLLLIQSGLRPVWCGHFMGAIA